HHAFSSGAGRTSDGNGSHASTLKSPSYTKSVSWQHYRRKKDIIVRGGENISSREVEDILLQHPKIHDACVVAMSDERLGERSCAYVVLKAPHHSLSLEEVVAFFSRKRVAKYKYPEHIVVIEKLPRTTSGKIQKFLLRKDIMRRLTQDVCEEIE
ncbi:hypothetical protein UY716_18720, partial [Escherichia coli]|nr:hypothetical protein [Escherichia coli]